MEYSEVIFVKEYMPNGLGVRITIDGIEWLYEVLEKTTRLYPVYWFDKNEFKTLFGVELPMNKDNPKETLDRFFNLLLLV